MPANYIATSARIRRIRRDSEFARVVAPGILAVRPDANDGFSSVRESFFDNVADAQVLLEELHDGALGFSRANEGAETDTPIKLGDDVPMTPALPQVHMIDGLANFDRVMIIKGLAVDHNSQRNSVEAIG
jgi:hypothetical protein